MILWLFTLEKWRSIYHLKLKRVGSIIQRVWQVQCQVKFFYLSPQGWWKNNCVLSFNFDKIVAIRNAWNWNINLLAFWILKWWQSIFIGLIEDHFLILDFIWNKLGSVIINFQIEIIECWIVSIYIINLYSNSMLSNLTIICRLEYHNILRIFFIETNRSCYISSCICLKLNI